MPQEYLFKVIVVGDMGTGKTSLINKRYVHNIFSQQYKSTIGVDFALKVLNWDDNTVIRLQLWDIAGQERYGNMTRVYYKEAVGAFIVYDITRPPTFEAVQRWKNDIESKVFLPTDNDDPIPCVLLANKCDLPDQINKSKKEMDEFCTEQGFVGWFETSAKENKNIHEAVRFLVQKILENHRKLMNEDTEDAGNAITLNDLTGNSDDASKKKKGCC